MGWNSTSTTRGNTVLSGTRETGDINCNTCVNQQVAHPDMQLLDIKKIFKFQIKYSSSNLSWTAKPVLKRKNHQGFASGYSYKYFHTWC